MAKKGSGGNKKAVSTPKKLRESYNNQKGSNSGSSPAGGRKNQVDTTSGTGPKSPNKKT